MRHRVSNEQPIRGRAAVAHNCREATMQVIVNTDHNIALSEESIGELESVVDTALGRFASHLTRVEVHLSDESGGRGTSDGIRCRLEARPEGRNPEFATEDAATVDAAVSGALRKLTQVLDTTFGRLDTHKGASSMGGVEPS